jgi:hypothetical protein
MDEERGFDSGHGTRDFSLPQRVQLGIRSHGTCYTMDTGGFFLGVKGAGE